MLLPQVDEVGLQRACDRAEIVETRHTTINLEGRHHEHLPEENVVEGGLVEGVLGLLLLHFLLKLRLELLKHLHG